MNNCCNLFHGLSILLLSKGIFSYRPTPETITYPPNTTWLSSSEENQVYFKELEEAVHKYTLPGTVADVLANHTVINTAGMEERMNYVKEFIRNRNKKYYNNQTGRFETYHQRMAKVNADMIDEMIDKENTERKDFKKERYLNDELVARFLAHHPNVSFIPEQHAVTDYDEEYSGDRIKDDYEVKRRKRGVDDIEAHVSNNKNELGLSKENIKTAVKNSGHQDQSVGSFNNNIVFIKHGRDSEDLNKGLAKEETIVARTYNIKHKRKRNKVHRYFLANKDVLKTLKYLVLKTELGENKHVVKRNVKDDSTHPRLKELYKDYKSDWPYSKYDSRFHHDYFVPAKLKRKKNSSDYKKRHTPESSIFNSFYNDGHYDLDKEREKKKNLLRSMEYWTFTDPFAKYTSTSTKKYDKPIPTFGRNAATISVGASRFKLFNRNWYNHYKHRIHKRDVFNSNSTAIKMIHKVGHCLWKVGNVYETIMNYFFKSVYKYLNDLYYQSNFGPSNEIQTEDPDYAKAAQRMSELFNNIPTFNPNLTFTIISQETEMQTQYIMLNWYTEKYNNNSTQYFCDYANDTYMLVNNTLKLYNKTIHQLVPEITNNKNESLETESGLIESINNIRTIEPPKLHCINSSEVKRLHLDISSNENEKYMVMKNMSNPSDTYQVSLNDILGRRRKVIFQNYTEQSDLQNYKRCSTNNATFSDNINQSIFSGAPTDYPEDFLDNAADFVLSFFIKNATYGLNKETTTDDYTEMTNDLFDKIENAAIALYKVSTNITSSADSTSEITNINQDTITMNTLFNVTQNDSTTTLILRGALANQTILNTSKKTLPTIKKLQNSSNSLNTKRKILPSPRKPSLYNNLNKKSKNILGIGKRILRAKRSLVSRCLKGIKFVGHVFRPIEKQIVNVLDDIFGPYSSSNDKSDQKDGIRNAFKPLKVVAHSSESIPVSHSHDALSMSSKEVIGPKKENSISENSAGYSPKSTIENNDFRELRKKSKRRKKHRKKHKHNDDPFDDTITTQSELGKQSEGIDNDFTIDDQTLPSFIKNPQFGDTPSTVKIIKGSKEHRKLPVSNPTFNTETGSNKIPDYNAAQDPYGRNQPFENPIRNDTFQDYDQQNPYGRNQPFGNPFGNGTFQDYDQQNLNGRNQPFGNTIVNNTFQEYGQPNPYEKNQPFGNPMGNNTFQDYDQQNMYGRNQPFGNSIGKNTFQDYDQQNMYGRNQPFGNPIGNNTLQDYDQQNPYGRNQPFGSPIGNNTLQDYDQQNPYGRNQPFRNPMGSNTLQDYDQQNPYGKNQPFENPMENNTFQDYDQQNPYGRNQPFGNPMGNNTFQDYDEQNPYGGNNTFPNYDQQNPYGGNQPFGNDLYKQTLSNNYPPNIPFNESNVINPYKNNYGEANDPQLNQNNGFQANPYAPAPSPNMMSPLMASNEAVKNDFANNAAIQKDTGNLMINQQQKDTQSNTSQMKSMVQNPQAGLHQVNVTNSIISIRSQLVSQTKTVDSSDRNVTKANFRENLLQNVSTIVTSEVSENYVSTSKAVLNSLVLNVSTISTPKVAGNNNSYSLIDSVSTVISTANISNKYSVGSAEVVNFTTTNLKLITDTTTINASQKDWKLDSARVPSLILTSQKSNITFDVDDWFNNNNNNNSNIFKNIFSKPDMISNSTDGYAVVENDNNTTIESIFLNASRNLEETSMKTKFKKTTLNDLNFESLSQLETDSHVNSSQHDKTSNISQIVNDKLTLEDLLKSIYVLNTSSINIKNLLDRFLQNSTGKEIISTAVRTVITETSTSGTTTVNQNLPDILTMNFSGSPYVLLKKDLLKANNYVPNIPNNNVINPFIQEPPLFNPFQNMMNLPPNTFNPYQNNILPQPYPLLDANNNMPGQVLNVSIGPYRQVYPNFVQPPFPILDPPVPPNQAVPT